MIEECIIIGGGVAGLSAANRLLELGVQPLIIEAGKYPSHRMCGEFFSPECLPILAKWDIGLSTSVQRCRFISKNKEIAFSLPQPAGGCSRYHFDMQLLESARHRGAKVLTESVCTALHRPKHEGDVYTIELSSGQSYHARQIMIGTGKLPSLANHHNRPPVYSGFKAHFHEVNWDGLEMHCFKGGYLGISPVDVDTVNVACIARLGQEAVIDEIVKKRMPSAHMIQDNWMTAKVPEFGIRENPSWPNTYWIGDAAGSIPPICGDGLGIAITTGIMASEYCVQHDWNQFKTDWYKRYHARFRWAQAMHHIIMRPTACYVGLTCCEWFTRLPQILFRHTRE